MRVGLATHQSALLGSCLFNDWEDLVDGLLESRKSIRLREDAGFREG